MHMVLHGNNGSMKLLHTPWDAILQGWVQIRAALLAGQNLLTIVLEVK